MNFDSFFERVIASTISGIIVSVVVILVVERALRNDETTVASVQKPMVWNEEPSMPHY